MGDQQGVEDEKGVGWPTRCWEAQQADISENGGPKEWRPTEWKQSEGRLRDGGPNRVGGVESGRPEGQRPGKWEIQNVGGPRSGGQGRRRPSEGQGGCRSLRCPWWCGRCFWSVGVITRVIICNVHYFALNAIEFYCAVSRYHEIFLPPLADSLTS